jgi:hypothetical protein
MTTKTKTDCKTKGLCHYDSLTRTKFFHGMLLTDDHLRAEQTYHRESLKRMNRYLFGSGIVCGLEVKEAGGFCLKVHPGFALDCGGNAIEVCKCITIDLADQCKKFYPEGCVTEDAPTIVKYLVLRHAEIPADPEPVLTPADDCTPGEGTKCEASKYREGFCLEIRDECPNPSACEGVTENDQDGLLPFLLNLPSGTDRTDIREQLKDVLPDCDTSPPCPKCHCHDCAVGLAKLEIDCAERTVTVDPECDCREYVWSPRLIRWLICAVLEGIEKVPPEQTGTQEPLPAARAFIAKPLRAVWDGGVTLAIGESKRVRQEVSNLEKRVAALEKSVKTKAPKE